MATFPMGTGQGLWSCPAGAGGAPGLQAKAATVALGTPGPGLAGVGKTMAGKGMIVGGGACKGLSLGLGIGLGLWGPAVLAGLGAAAAYSLWRSRAAINALCEDEIEIGEALSSR